MQAIKQLYRIGYGPSSSHTIAPFRIARLYREQHPDVRSFKIVLGGSLALTAKGHGTIDIIKRALQSEDVDFEFDFNDPEKIKPADYSVQVTDTGIKFTIPACSVVSIILSK